MAREAMRRIRRRTAESYMHVEDEFYVGARHPSEVRRNKVFINHSCDPNLRYDVFGNVVAARRIGKGEEVFIDYGCFIVNFDEPFHCACGAPNCRGRIRRQDWKKLAITYGMNMPRFLHSRIARELKNDREERRYRRNGGLVGEPKPSAA